jgi:soluble lytic murein transglycosylase-like protein
MATLPIPPLRRLNFMQAPATVVPDLSTPVIPAFVPPHLLGNPAAPAFPAPAMPQVLPQLPPLPAPNVTAAPVAPAAPAAPTITPLDIGPVGPIAQLEDRYSNLVTARPGVEQIRNPLLRGLGRVGDVLLGTTLPGLAARMPGTSLHHDVLVSQAAQDVNQARKDELEAAQAAHFANVAAATKAGTDPTLGYLREGWVRDPNSPTGFRPGTPDELGPVLGSLVSQRQAALDPNSVQNQIRQQQLEARQQQIQETARHYGITEQQAAQRLDQQALTQANLNTREQQKLAFRQDQAYNPQPTGTERARGDLATSALLQTSTLRDIIARRPDLFGPGRGSITQFQQWLGSEDADAAKYRAATEFFAGHAMGVFGARNQTILADHKRILETTQNPAALNGVLDQIERTMQGFQEAGTVRRRPEELAAPIPVAGAPQQGLHPGLTRYDPIIESGISQYPQVDKNMVYALMQGENATGDPTAKARDAQGRVVPGGGVGVMQLTPSTANRLGVTDRTDPNQNIPGGIARFDEALTRHGGDLRLAAADYFHGPEAVQDGQIVDAEARRYADGFMRRYATLSGRGPAVAAAVGPTPSAETTQPPATPAAGRGGQVLRYNPATGRVE